MLWFVLTEAGACAGGAPYGCCCTMGGPRSMSSRSPIRLSAPGITVACGAWGASGWIPSSSPEPALQQKHGQCHQRLNDTTLHTKTLA